MRTLCLKLSDAVAARLTVAARKRGQSKSALVRAMLDTCLQQRDALTEGSCLDLAADLAGCIEGPSDLSVDKRHLRGYGQ